MTIFEKAKQDGYVTIYSDTPDTVERRITAYNKRMDDCRFRKKHMRELEFAFFVANPLIVFCVIAAEADTLFTQPKLTLAALLVFAIGFVKFAIVDQRLISATAFTLLLAMQHLGFLILIAADVIISLWHDGMKRRLISEPGYPAFADIAVKHEKTPAPQGYYEKYKEK